MQKTLFPGTYWVHTGECIQSVCSGRSCVRGAQVRRGCGEGVWVSTWVRGGCAWLRGWSVCVGLVPLASAQTRADGVRADAWGAGRQCVFPQCGVGHAWALGLVWRPVSLSGLFAPVVVSGMAQLLRGGRVLFGKVPNNAYSQGSQELSSSAGAY